jgi:uncharacterized damage-inducible protein DinB
MEAQHAKTIADFLAADFEQEMATTLQVLAALPTDRLDYRPDPKAKTGIGLARHLALVDAWLLNCIADGAFTAPPDDSDACGITTPAEVVDRYQRDVPAALDRVRALPAEKLASVIDSFGVSPVQLLATTIKHSVHHRGQLSSYLRAMGGKVPEMYGPSADSQ